MTTDHYKSNFMRQHLIKEIFRNTYSARNILGVKHDSFIFFDDPIRVKNGRINQIINRFGKGSLYCKNEIIPIPWTAVNGNQLIDILNKVRNKEFYSHKDIDGKSCKIRIKNAK